MLLWRRLYFKSSLFSLKWRIIRILGYFSPIFIRVIVFGHTRLLTSILFVSICCHIFALKGPFLAHFSNLFVLIWTPRWLLSKKALIMNGHDTCIMVILILIFFLEEHFICVVATHHSVVVVSQAALQRGPRLLGFDIVVLLWFI